MIPISSHQDTVGPIARSVTDATILLSVISGPDPRDNYTLAQPPVLPDFMEALKFNALQGKRLGVPRKLFAHLNPIQVSAFDEALRIIRKLLGATVVDPADLPDTEELEASMLSNETLVCRTDFKVSIRMLCTK